MVKRSLIVWLSLLTMSNTCFSLDIVSLGTNLYQIIFSSVKNVSVWVTVDGNSPNPANASDNYYEDESEGAWVHPELRKQYSAASAFDYVPLSNEGFSSASATPPAQKGESFNEEVDLSGDDEEQLVPQPTGVIMPQSVIKILEKKDLKDISLKDLKLKILKDARFSKAGDNQSANDWMVPRYSEWINAELMRQKKRMELQVVCAEGKKCSVNNYLHHVQGKLQVKSECICDGETAELLHLGRIFLRKAREKGLSKIDEKMYKRLQAIIATIESPKPYIKRNSLTAYKRKMDRTLRRRLECGEGNAVQHNITEEVADFISRYVDLRYVHQNIYKKDFVDIYELSNMVLKFKDKKEYEKAYSFADFCSVLVDTTMVRALTVISRGIGDAVNQFSTQTRELIDDFLDRFLGCKSLSSEQNGFGEATFGFSSPAGGISPSDKLHDEWEDLQKKWHTFLGSIKQFVLLCKNDPESAVVKTVSHLTQTTLNLGLWHAGLTGLENIAQNASLSAGQAFSRSRVALQQRYDMAFVGGKQESVWMLEKKGIDSAVLEKPRRVRMEWGYDKAVEKMLHEVDLSELSDSKLLDKLDFFINESVEYRVTHKFGNTRRVQIRRDLGRNAHPLRVQGYAEPVNHYNIELQMKKATKVNGWKTNYKYHIVVDTDGKVINFFGKHIE